MCLHALLHVSSRSLVCVFTLSCMCLNTHVKCSMCLHAIAKVSLFFLNLEEIDSSDKYAVYYEINDDY